MNAFFGHRQSLTAGWAVSRGCTNWPVNTTRNFWRRKWTPAERTCRGVFARMTRCFTPRRVAHIPQRTFTIEAPNLHGRKAEGKSPQRAPNREVSAYTCMEFNKCLALPQADEIHRGNRNSFLFTWETNVSERDLKAEIKRLAAVKLGRTDRWIQTPHRERLHIDRTERAEEKKIPPWNR